MARTTKSAAEQAVEDGRKRQAEAVAETERRMAEARPTPTQEENDLAKVGALNIDEKEPDGSAPDSVAARDATASGKPAGYQTRDTKKND